MFPFQTENCILHRH